MEKIVAAFTARRQFGQILDQVMSKGDRFVVERNGKRIAALVPIDDYEHWKASREHFFDNLREVAGRVNLADDDAMVIANEAVKAVRRQDV